MPINRSGTLIAGLALGLATGGCSTLLGDFGSGGGETVTDGGTIVLHDGGSSSGASSSGGSSGGDSSAMMPTDAATEASPPPPGKPGFDVTSGGNTSVSNNYKLVGAVSESPGGNGISTSTHYILQGGVITGTKTQ